ncbi:MAG: RHS repeat protein, partial [Deltaproteobacteria bacterium]|nr:RHS repeat protein [Deltaproteobacteria bacterium]
MGLAIRATCFLAIILVAFDARAAEICNNGMDDDADGLVDDQCYPSLTTSRCENPLSCQETGQVSPSTGSLRYELPPDVAPGVPFGPAIAFKRYFQSQRAPGLLAPAYRKALGERWGHSYASWLDKNTAPSPDQIVLHLPRGQEAMFKYTSTAGGFDYYNSFQPGFHFIHLRQRTTSPNEYQLKTLTGETLVYDGAGKLIEIWDTLATPNKATLAYDGNGMLSTVTDSSGKRRLLFSYQAVTNLITSVVFQINTGTWISQHTTSFGYTATLLTTITIGGQLAQTNNYDLNGNLTSVVDGESKTLVSFAYDAATTGKVVRVDTPRGVVGYEFNSSRSECSGKTVLYFHRANTVSCDTDAGCGTGNLCGGKTGLGSTGQCFRGARCLTVSSPSEDVITTVAAFAGSSEPCDGACLDAIDHVWGAAG